MCALHMRESRIPLRAGAAARRPAATPGTSRAPGGRPAGRPAGPPAGPGPPPAANMKTARPGPAGG